MKKTKSSEKKANKRKTSTPSKSSEAKRLKTLPTTSSAPMDATPLSVAPSYMIVPFGEEHIISEQDEEMDDNRSAASTPLDEEIQADQIPQVSTPPPQNPEMTVEDKEADENIGSSTPVIHD